jgi:low temperature requirement protein LtrA
MPIPDTSHSSNQKREVTYLELFFDLVFVFAVSQLSHHLLTHLSWHGAAETLVMLLSVFGVWMITSWASTLLHADQSRIRWMVMAVMLLGLIMNSSIAGAFTRSGWAFVVPLVLIQLGRTVWILVNSPAAVYREHYFRTLLWLIAITPIWLIGAAVGPEARLPWWAAAAVLDQTGRWLAHPIPGRKLRSENIEFDADHMLERCRLFLLIALGETVVTTGSAIAGSPMTLMTLLTGTMALVGTVALWSLIFGRSYELTLRHLEKTKNPLRTSIHAANALIVMVAGLIAVAVANEVVIAHPHGHASLALSLLLAGGPILFLTAQGGYLRTALNVRSCLHPIAAAALALVGLATPAIPPYAALILVSGSLAAIAILDGQRTGIKSDQAMVRT